MPGIKKNGHAVVDKDGAWAGSGKLHQPLLDQLLDHPYFRQPPPKSTGRELFCLRWLDEILESGYPTLAAADIQRTLTELTAHSVAASLKRFTENVQQLLVCGGGAHNSFLMQRIGALLPQCQIESTEGYGLHPDWAQPTRAGDSALSRRNRLVTRYTSARQSAHNHVSIHPHKPG